MKRSSILLLSVAWLCGVSGVARAHGKTAQLSAVQTAADVILTLDALRLMTHVEGEAIPRR